MFGIVYGECPHIFATEPDYSLITLLRIDKKIPSRLRGYLNLFRRRLSTQAKFSNNCTVTLDITVLQVVKE